MADREPGIPSFSEEENGALQLGVRVAQATDVGRRRRDNQDSYQVLRLEGGVIPPDGGLAEIAEGHLLLAVADGMGGHFGGEVASRLCIEHLTQELVSHFHTSINGRPDLPLILQNAVNAAHEAVLAYARAYAENVTMGTTLTAGLLHGTRVELAQVGDSRAYLFREGNLILLTQDQTIGNRLRSRGDNPANVDPRIQEMLVQAVGAQVELDIVMTAVDLEPHDVLLICCDGLYKVVPPQGIVEILECEIGLSQKAAHLVNRANEGGGPDNITVILAEFCQAESAN